MRALARDRFGAPYNRDELRQLTVQLSGAWRPRVGVLIVPYPIPDHHLAQGAAALKYDDRKPSPKRVCPLFLDFRIPS